MLFDWKSLVILDGEFPHRDVTQGKDPLSYGAVSLDSPNPKTWFYGEAHLSSDVGVEPPTEGDIGSLAVAGFTHEMAYNPKRPNAKELLTALLDWRANMQNGGVFACQNNLDLTYLENSARRWGIPFPKGLYRIVDLHTLAFVYLIGNHARLNEDPALTKKIKLSNHGTSQLGLPVIGLMVGVEVDRYRQTAHNALVDAVVSAEITHRLINSGQPLFSNLNDAVVIANAMVVEYRARFED